MDWQRTSQGHSLDPVEGQGSALEPATGFAPGPQQRAEPFAIYQLGFVLRGGPTRTYRGHGRPSPENKPINGFQGPLPLAEVEEAEPPGGSRGEAPVPHRPERLSHRAVPAATGPVETFCQHMPI